MSNGSEGLFDDLDIIERPAFERMAQDLEEERGIQELMDIIDAMEALGLTLIREVKEDGLQYTDLFQVPLNKDLRSKVVEAFRDSEKIPAEVEDLSRNERRALIHRAVDMVHNIEEALTE